MQQKSLVRTPSKIYRKTDVDGEIILKNAPERQILEGVFYYVAHNKNERWASVITVSTPRIL
jgi:5-formaminoimidazole-4-carboxamide-1-beta-D-ribofuranosyl 5'-monophosphate synthetase